MIPCPNCKAEMLDYLDKCCNFGHVNQKSPEDDEINANDIEGD